eukprot:11046390-Lingulodinium_polyedra.AAC.1
MLAGLWPSQNPPCNEPRSSGCSRRAALLFSKRTRTASMARRAKTLTRYLKRRRRGENHGAPTGRFLSAT